MSYGVLPALNAFLNACAAILLVIGFRMIRAGRVRSHQAVMLTAFATSTLFLIGYLVHHAHVGHVRYTGVGMWRTLYFVVLITHTILAAVIVPMILRTLFLAFKGRFDQHKALARWTLSFWLYVSVTGVVIYKMLY